MVYSIASVQSGIRIVIDDIVIERTTLSSLLLHYNKLIMLFSGCTNITTLTSHNVYCCVNTSANIEAQRNSSHI